MQVYGGWGSTERTFKDFEDNQNTDIISINNKTESQPTRERIKAEKRIKEQINELMNLIITYIIIK